MHGLEQEIKGFLREQGVEVMGCAGPERLNGPPSLDPTYTMRGAKSIVCFALPMDVPAIEEFLSKKSPVPHNLDQLRKNQDIHRIAKELEGFIESKGFRAKATAPNNLYRRSLDVFKTYPNFSHRFGAIAAGIAGQALSGNVMTEKWGAAVYLNTVMTDAVLESDPAYTPRHFLDNYCKKCNVCYQACPAGMFDGVKSEEQILLNGELHPRGNRHSIDLCNASCFGLHGLSRDKTWSSWGRHWMNSWVDNPPHPDDRQKIRRQMLIKGAKVGDSTVRFELIRRLGSTIQPKKFMDHVPHAHEIPEDEREQTRILNENAERIGVKGLKDTSVLTCGQCALVCGPDPKESMRRFRLLQEGGIVVPGPEGRMVKVKTFEEAQEIRRQYPQHVSREEMKADGKASFWLWHRSYFGIEPRSIIQGLIYKWKLRRAIANHRALPASGQLPVSDDGVSQPAAQE